MKVDVNTIAPHGFALLEGVTAEAPSKTNVTLYYYCNPR
jgi:hypothetical protein